MDNTLHSLKQNKTHLSFYNQLWLARAKFWICRLVTSKDLMLSFHSTICHLSGLPDVSCHRWNHDVSTGMKCCKSSLPCVLRHQTNPHRSKKPRLVTLLPSKQVIESCCWFLGVLLFLAACSFKPTVLPNWESNSTILTDWNKYENMHSAIIVLVKRCTAVQTKMLSLVTIFTFIGKISTEVLNILVTNMVLSHKHCDV